MGFNIIFTEFNLHYLYIQSRYDGVESHFLAEITKHWSFEPVNLPHVQDNYEVTLGEVDANRSDIAMCSNWLSLSLLRRYDCSRFFDYMCGTFLVPNPVIMNEASNTIRAYSAWMWLYNILSLVLTSVCLTIVTKTTQRLYDLSELDTQIYRSFSRSFMDAFAISMNQCIPASRSVFSIKCILIA